MERDHGGRNAPSRDPPARVWPVGLGLGAAYFVLVASTLRDVGLTWDEPFYYRAGLFAFDWWLRLPLALGTEFTRAGIAHAWDLNPEHPPFAKLVFGATFFLFHAWIPVTDSLTAFRLGSALFGAFVVGVAYAWGAEAISRRAGFFAAAFMAFSPRLFFHFHLAALDGPAAAMALGAAYFWWRAQRSETKSSEHRPRRVLVAALVLGCAIATKSVVFVLPLALLAWAFLARRATRREAWLPFLGAPVVFFVLWPYLWFDPLRNFFRFLSFQSQHAANAPVYYFGAIEYPPPWHYPFVLALLVVPLPLAALAIVGFVRGAKELARLRLSSRALATPLFALVALAFLVAAALGPRYDGERLFEPAFPFLAMLAASGLDALLARWLSPRRRGEFAAFAPSRSTRVALAALAVVLLLAPGAFATWSTREDGEVYYNELVGGTAHAGANGFTTEYWSAGIVGLIPWLNENVPRNGSIYVADEGFGTYLFAPYRGHAFPDFVVERDPALVARAAFAARLRPDIIVGIPTFAESGVPGVGSDPCTATPPSPDCLALLYAGPWELGPRSGTNLVVVLFDEGDFTPFVANTIDHGTLRIAYRVDGALVAAVYEVSLSAKDTKGP